jgi:hypothetical protein
VDDLIREWLDRYRGWGFHEAKKLIAESLVDDLENGNIFFLTQSPLSPQFRWQRERIKKQWGFDDSDDPFKEEQYQKEWEEDHPFPGVETSFSAFWDEDGFSDNFMGEEIGGR